MLKKGRQAPRNKRFPCSSDGSARSQSPFFNGLLGYGFGITCWRRLDEWQKAGVRDAIWTMLIDALGREGLVDWSLVVIDSCSVRAAFGGRTLAPTP